MKRFYSIILALVLGFQGFAQMQNHEVAQEQSYVKDVFFSFRDGVVKSSDRASWDLAFSTEAFSAAVLLNNGAGAMAWAHPETDTTQWSQPVDTTGLSAWTPLFNSDTTWEEGAFNQQASGHPDYGWGLYNMLDHNVYGHRMFVIKTIDGLYKKLWIKKKTSSALLYEVAISDLDHSNDAVLELDATTHSSENFAYYSIANNEMVDYEPASESWDIVFSRYYDVEIPYYVTGVLHNYQTSVAEVLGVDPSFSDTTGLFYSESIKTIGSDWKAFDMGSMTWSVNTNTVYFVKTQHGEIYRMGFTEFEGQGTGITRFWSEAIVQVGMESFAGEHSLRVFPNPVNTEFFVEGLSSDKETVLMKLFNQQGSEVVGFTAEPLAGRTRFALPSNLASGIYFLQLTTGNNTVTKKIVKQ